MIRLRSSEEPQSIERRLLTPDIRVLKRRQSQWSNPPERQAHWERGNKTNDMTLMSVMRGGGGNQHMIFGHQRRHQAYFPQKTGLYSFPQKSHCVNLSTIIIQYFYTIWNSYLLVLWAEWILLKWPSTISIVDVHSQIKTCDRVM